MERTGLIIVGPNDVVKELWYYAKKVIPTKLTIDECIQECDDCHNIVCKTSTDDSIGCSFHYSFVIPSRWLENNNAEELTMKLLNKFKLAYATAQHEDN